MSWRDLNGVIRFLTYDKIIIIIIMDLIKITPKINNNMFLLS